MFIKRKKPKKFINIKLKSYNFIRKSKIGSGSK